MPVLIQHADYLVRSADRIERDADLLIDGARIAQIGRITPPVPADTTILDGRGCIVIPGLINTHAHLYQSFLRGLADDLALVDWCNQTVFPLTNVAHYEEKVEGNQMGGHHWATMSALELLRGGVTTCVDMYLHMDSVCRAWQAIGLRGVVALALVDRWIPASFRQTTQVVQTQALEFIRAWHKRDSRIQIMLAPSAPFICTPALLAWTRETSAQFNLGIQTHVSETQYEIQVVQSETGLSPVAYLAQLGLLGERTTAVHCVHVSESDLATLAETQTTVVHCPKSNLKLASGIAPIPQMLARGVRVALATDGAASNDTLDMFEEMRVAAMLPKGAAQDAKAMTARQVFAMATEAGARALGIDAGTLDPGKLADIAILNRRKPHLVPLHDPINALVYAARASDVETTIVNGAIVMRDRVMLTLDESAAIQAADDYARKLYARGLELWRTANAD